jgi:hypothetical protein
MDRRVGKCMVTIYHQGATFLAIVTDTDADEGEGDE